MQRFSFLGQRSSSSCASRPTGNKLRTCTISSHCYAARPLRAEGDSHICRALRRLPSILRERSFPLNFAALGEELEGGKFKLQNRGRLECFHSASSPWCGVCTAREPSSDVRVLDCVGCFCFLFLFFMSEDARFFFAESERGHHVLDVSQWPSRRAHVLRAHLDDGRWCSSDLPENRLSA